MPFFPETDHAFNRFTELFDFTWTSHVALWNLRWQVRGFRTEVPNATNNILASRFAAGHDRSAVNLVRTCEEWTWEQQERIFAFYVLTSAFAIYEGWLDSVLGALKVPKKQRIPIAKALQFPTQRKPDGTLDSGFLYGIETIRGTGFELGSRLGKTLRNNRKYPGSAIEDLLSCLRYFKEARNCIIHSDGRASPKLIAAAAAFNECAPRLLLKEVPEYTQPREGDAVRLVIRGVVGFTDVLKQIVVYTDCALAESELAEGALSDRFGKAKKILPSDPSLANAAVTRMFRKLQLGVPEEDVSIARDFLIKHGAVTRV